MADVEIPVHPVQVKRGYSNEKAVVSQTVTMAAYEVYSHVFGEQKALITGGCRGGFGVGELIAFLYARSFPKTEWSARFREGLRGIRGI